MHQGARAVTSSLLLFLASSSSSSLWAQELATASILEPISTLCAPIPAWLYLRLPPYRTWFKHSPHSELSLAKMWGHWKGCPHCGHEIMSTKLSSIQDGLRLFIDSFRLLMFSSFKTFAASDGIDSVSNSCLCTVNSRSSASCKSQYRILIYETYYLCFRYTCGRLLGGIMTCTVISLSSAPPPL